MKFKMIFLLTLVLMLTACSSFREIDVTDDGELRRITTEDTSEIDIPGKPENIVLFRTIDPGNAALLGYEPTAVNRALEGNETLTNEVGQSLTFLEPGDIEGLKAVDPDLIVTYSPDEYFDQYSEVAPTIRMSYSGGILSPFSPRVYLTQLYYLGVILNKEEEANKIGDEWEGQTTVLKRELNTQVDDKNAVVAVANEDGYLLYNEYMSYGTEAVYDVLGFQMDGALQSHLEDNLFDVKTPSDLSEFEADYVFVNTPDYENEDIKSEFAQAMDIDKDHVILLNSEDTITNDLISIQKQTEYIVDKINEAGE
ncbi:MULTISPECIES: ABC transporter substrate-binding protein [Jeotgalicoccus]|uniref:ABC transporter substrate-binding protein n=1 Tax=Jeotgalicoccus TaxID=227979 RepID=UPI0003F92B12|nr:MULTISPECIES: ABC transporter substrate-binding protein [Jeotgalicoccus]QQD85013.1 ABC transporter substrate-binding protein [Jeotgalicoccus sp. ATCC 8456]